jgi:hypothetical protein
MSVSGRFVGTLQPTEDRYGGQDIKLEADEVEDLKTFPTPRPLREREVTFLERPNFAYAKSGAPTTLLDCNILTDGELKLCLPSVDAKVWWKTGWDEGAAAVEKTHVAPLTRNGRPTRGRKLTVSVPLSEDREPYKDE